MADNTKPLAALLSKAADRQTVAPRRTSLGVEDHRLLSYQHLAVEKQILQYNQPTAAQFVKDAETRLMIEAINKKLKLLYEELDVVKTKEVEDEEELDNLEEEVDSEGRQIKSTQRDIMDATKSIDKITGYAGNIASNIQNIASKMGAYVTTLKETRESIQTEREASASANAPVTKMSVGEFLGSLRTIDQRGGALGVLGQGLLREPVEP